MFDRFRHRGSDERGATLVILSVSLTALLGIAGLVVDFGLVRTDRQQNKSAADLAVAAGMRSLEYAGYPAPFRGVCEAVKYLRANQPELAGMTGTYANGNGVGLASDPCTTTAPQWKQLCVPNAKESWAWYRGTAQGGRLVVDVKSGYDLTDGSFGEETLIGGDAGSPAMGNCDHLAVIITETQTPGLGKVVFSGNLSSTIRSVGRVTQSIDALAVITLLLLEREDCDVLTFNGTESAILVQGNGTKSGIVHSDSIGTGDNCNNQILNAAAAVIGAPYFYTGPSLVAGRAPLAANPPDPPESGHVSVAALAGYPGAVPSKAATDCPTTIYAEPGSLIPPGPCVEGSSRKGRDNVDVLYRERMSDLRADAAARVMWAQPQADAWGLAQQAATSDPYRYYNNCPTGVVPERFVFIDGSCNNQAPVFTHDDAEVIIDGSLSGAATFVSPALVVVGNGVSESGSTVLSVNAGPSANCTARGDATQGGDRTQSSKFVVVQGSFKATGGTSRLCQTLLFLADANSSGSSCGLPAIPTTNGVPPYDNCFDGNLDVGGEATLDWTAPNATPNAMEFGDPADVPFLDNFEDLAFWTETQTGNKLSGGGANVMKGIFFMPNADPFNITGGASQAIERDAQFIVRRLAMGGQGFLSLRPSSNDSLKFPYFSGFTLVR